MSQLVEIKDVRQRPNEGFRRWFSSDYFDVIFWYDQENGNPLGFQFCYGKPNHEKAYTWEFVTQSHHYVSEFTRIGNATGILWGNAGKVPQKVIHKFYLDSEKISNDLRKAVLDQLQEFNHSESIA